MDTIKSKERKLAVAYARYSSSNQREESIEEQVMRIQDYADSNNINIIGQYTDYAKSGSKNLQKREEFLNMIDDITSKKISTEKNLQIIMSSSSVLLKHLMMVQNLSSWNQYWKVWQNTFQEIYPEKSCVDCTITQSMVFSQVVNHL